MSWPKNRAVAIAKDLLDGKIHPVEASRQLSSLRHDIEMEDDSSFLVFVAVDSDTPDWIPDEDRQLYSKRFLAKADTEIREYLKLVLPEMLKSGKEIIEKHS